MIEFIKLLSENSNKGYRFAFNFLKLILLIIFLKSISEKYIGDSLDFNITLKDFTITKIFNLLIIVIVSWYVLWEVLESLFSYLFIEVFSKTTYLQDVNQITKERHILMRILKLLNVFDGKKEFNIPGKNLSTFVEIKNSIIMQSKDTNFMLSEILFFVYALLFYLTFIIHLYKNHPVVFFVALILVILGTIIFFNVKKFISILRSDDKVISYFISILKFREAVMEVVIYDLKGIIDYENQSFKFKWDNEEISIYDFYHYNTEIGNKVFFKNLKEKDFKNPQNSILVFSFNIDDKMSKLMKSKNLNYFVIENEDAILGQIISKTNEIFNKS